MTGRNYNWQVSKEQVSGYSDEQFEAWIHQDRETFELFATRANDFNADISVYREIFERDFTPFYCNCGEPFFSSNPNFTEEMTLAIENDPVYRRISDWVMAEKHRSCDLRRL